jgi:hypothetical protein
MSAIIVCCSRMIRSVVARVCLMVVLVGLPACDSGTKQTACTLIGCTSGVTVDIAPFVRPDRAVSRASICIDGHCEQQDLSNGNLMLVSTTTRIAREVVVTVRIELQSADGRVLATDAIRTRLHKVQPNGPRCEPTCFSASLRLTRVGKLETGG